ncbi:E3 SUMO-protein ligase pli1 [Basidiobolus ranarum]|uniref:E3 SUMO-protein ligase pli1 n=1 Tax=Basidiobolus ranarum TaxID=34480 RepID=A0ABR2WA38_9FUNG
MVEHTDPTLKALIDITIPSLTSNSLKNCLRALNIKSPDEFPLLPLGKKKNLVKKLQAYLIKAQQPSPYSALAIAARKIIQTESERIAPKPSRKQPPIQETKNAQSGSVNDMDWSELTFKTSPFYTIVEKVGLLKFSAAQQSISTIILSFQLRSHQIAQLTDKDDKYSQYRIMIFSTDVDPRRTDNNSLKEQLIEFPPLTCISVNKHLFTGNSQGNKRKPGTTNPPDITDLCNPKIGGINRIEITYPGTTKAYVYVVYLVKITTVQEVMNKIKSHSKMSKTAVLEKINRSSKDADIEATSSLVSLKCPLGYQRIQYPCRSSYCNHIQCFDGIIFLKLNEQSPSWTCPICNRVMGSWSELVLDGYFEDILKKVDSDVDRVIVEVDGSWRLPDKEQDKEKSLSIKHEDIIIHTSSESEYEPNSPKSEVGVTRGKRSSEVIDLTFSSDEESWQPSKRPKRLSSSRTKK